MQGNNDGDQIGCESEDFKSTSLGTSTVLPVVQVILHIAHQLPEEELTQFQNDLESIVSRGRVQVYSSYWWCKENLIDLLQN